MFDRLLSLIGKENFEKIADTKILLLGVGGVGGHLAEALVRSGIKKLTIVDKDVVDITNLNRQIIALGSTMGRKKVEVLKERLSDINPKVEVDTSDATLTEDLEGLELDEYDYVLDCIDDTKVKVSLAKRCLAENIALISSTGTAKKMDPSKLYMTTLDKTSYDPLAKKMRMELRGYDTKKLVVLASDEPPLDCESNTLGSTAFVPASAGLLIASYVIRDIIKK